MDTPYGSIFVCRYCGNSRHIFLINPKEWQRHILWSNQYGKEVRWFCQRCGAWYDETMMYSDHVYTVRTVREGCEK